LFNEPCCQIHDPESSDRERHPRLCLQSTKSVRFECALLFSSLSTFQHGREVAMQRLRITSCWREPQHKAYLSTRLASNRYSPSRVASSNTLGGLLAWISCMGRTPRSRLCYGSTISCAALLFSSFKRCMRAGRAASAWSGTAVAMLLSTRPAMYKYQTCLKRPFSALIEEIDRISLYAITRVMQQRRNTPVGKQRRLPPVFNCRSSQMRSYINYTFSN
jgi:hypothetical protein